MGLTDGPSPVEVEIKFDVLDRRAARSDLLGDDLGGLAPAGPALRVRLVDRYLDTQGERLRRSGWAARIRTVGAASRIQLKQLGATDKDGVARRRELDGPAVPGDPVEDWPRSFARRRLIQLAHGEPVAEILTLRQDRLVRRFGDGPGALEMSLDRVEVLVGDEAVGRRLILELEQQDASDETFAHVAAFLRARPYLSIVTTTKLAWAADLGARGRSEDGLPLLTGPDLIFRADDSTAEAGRRILRNQIRRLLDRERAVREQPAAEEIRRLRVATRRVRATWRTFGPSYTGTRPEQIRRGLRRFWRLLTNVRDLDVLLARLDAYAEVPGTDRHDLLQNLLATVVERRTRALTALIDELPSSRHVRWIEAFVDFVESPGRGVVPVEPPAARRLQDEVGGWIWSGYERLLAWEPLLPLADVDALHQLRIEAKRLRDLILVVTPIVGVPTGTATAGLVGLQDAIGAMNDAAVTASVVRAYLAERTMLTPDETRAAERFALAQERQVAIARRRVPAAWRRVTGPAGRRRIAQVIGTI
ncbi:MAG: CHAD domain-containing protein [Chloroflexi bacterium]|nr:CHAD domain-containing protein [Chloroflexota bacterium]